MTEIFVKKTAKSQEYLQNVKSGDAFEYFLQSKKATPVKRGLSDLGAHNLRYTTCDILTTATLMTLQIIMRRLTL